MRATTQGNALVDYLITHAESLLRDLHAQGSGPASATAGPLRTLSPSRPAGYINAVTSGELGAETQVCGCYPFIFAFASGVSQLTPC